MSFHIYDEIMKKRVLFVCSGNSARSLMAEAMLRDLSGREIEVKSAGFAPSSPHPEALKALKKRAISTVNLCSKSIASLESDSFDYVISLCERAREECSELFAEQNYIAWDLPDPAKSEKATAFEETATELTERIRMFLTILQRDSERPNLYDEPQDFFKIMADPLRLRMTLLLAQHGELCVCDLVAATGMSQPKVSRHLAQLREYGLLSDRKDARWVYYRLNPGLPDWMRNVIQLTLNAKTPLIKTA